jgi:hypothetical protein
MSTQTKSKSPATPSRKQKTVDPRPKYSLGQKVYYISFHKGMPENLFQVKVIKRNSTEYWSGSSSDLKPTLKHYFLYDLFSEVLEAKDIYEERLYPSFFEAAKVFAKSFLTLLK